MLRCYFKLPSLLLLHCVIRWLVGSSCDSGSSTEAWRSTANRDACFPVTCIRDIDHPLGRALRKKCTDSILKPVQPALCDRGSQSFHSASLCYLCHATETVPHKSLADTISPSYLRDRRNRKHVEAKTVHQDLFSVLKTPFFGS